MGVSQDYPDVPDWVAKDKGYDAGAMVKYKGNVFNAAFWGSEPGVGDADHNGFRLYDELYDQTRDTPTDRAKIIGYIPTWRKEEGFNYGNDMMYQNITHGIIAFLMFSDADPGEFDQKAVSDVNAIIAEVVAAGHRNGARILVALGGATDYGFFHLMERIGQDPADPMLIQVVQRVVVFVKSNNLDGVDLDLECWWDASGDPSKDQGGRPASQRPHPAGRGLVVFAQLLRQAMPDKVICATTFATSWYGNNYDASLIHYVDWLAVMTYDLTGSWNNSPVGPHTALNKIRQKGKEPPLVSHAGPFQEDYQVEQQGTWPPPNPTKASKDPISDNPILSVEDSLWYWSNPLFTDWLGPGQQVPRSKLVGGVPLYGYDFVHAKGPDKLSKQVPPGYETIKYSDILAEFPNAETMATPNIKVSGSTRRPSFIAAPGSYNFARNIYFESIPTAVTKLDFLKSVGVQGVVIWELSCDVWEAGKSITAALYERSGNGVKQPLSTANPLTPPIEAASWITVTSINAVAQSQETEKSPIPLLVETSLTPVLILYFGTVAVPPADAEFIRVSWTDIENEARRYRRDDPSVFALFFSLRAKVVALINWLESKVRVAGIGWMYVSFYQFALLLHVCIQLEWIALRFPNPLNPPLPKPPTTGNSNQDNPDDEKECEREMGDTANSIDHYVEQLQTLRSMWPGFDLGPIDVVLGDGVPAPSPTPPTGSPGSPPAAPATPPKFRYSVDVSTAGIGVGAIIGITFYTEDQQKKLAVFAGGAAGLALGLTSLPGKAELNFDVESISRQHWAATFHASPIGVSPNSMQVDFIGRSGEAIGFVKAAGIGGIGVAIVTGNGDFRLPLGGTFDPPGGSGGGRGGHGVI